MHASIKAHKSKLDFRTSNVLHLKRADKKKFAKIETIQSPKI